MSSTTGTSRPSRTPDDPFGPPDRASGVTSDGAAWLASAATHPRSALALWRERPDAPVVLPCGTVFDVVSAPALFGRRMLDGLWDEGPGSGPVAACRGRVLIFAGPGSAQRLPSLLSWEEWGRTGAVPPLLCHGAGDAVTLPAPLPTTPSPGTSPGVSTSGDVRWVVGPDSLRPWLPGPELLLWAAVRAARATPRISIFPPPDLGANVYDVSRRR
jgi:hypothetical protein